MPPRNKHANTASELAARHTRAKRGLPKNVKREKPKRPRKRGTRQRVAESSGFGRLLRSFGVLIVGMIVLGGAAILFRSLTGSQFFTVKEIALEGTNRTSREE